MTDDPQYQPWDDFGLYKRMSIPRETQRDALDSLKLFVAELRVLRERYQITDVVVVASVKIVDEQRQYMAAGMGAQEQSGTLAAHAFRIYAKPVVELADSIVQLARIAPQET